MPLTPLQRRQALKDGMRAIIEATEVGNRDFTAAEQTSYDEMRAEMDAIEVVPSCRSDLVLALQSVGFPRSAARLVAEGGWPALAAHVSGADAETEAASRIANGLTAATHRLKSLKFKG